LNNYKAEIISIGNEILSGYTVNTNATYVSEQMLAIGLPVHWITTISDTSSDILSALQTANHRADVTLVTGGLGPTPDDITRETICKFFKTELVLDKSVEENVEKLLEGRGLTLLESNRMQAMVPAGSFIFQNPIGTAPGIVLKDKNRYFIFMPGVPNEMRRMVSEQVAKFLREKFDLPNIHNYLLRTTGIAESRLYEYLRDIINKNPHFPVAFLPRHIGVDLRFRLISDDPEQINQFNDFIEKIRLRIEKFIFTNEYIELEEKVGQILAENKLTIACAESFTGGLIGDLITNIPGSSDYFLGGVITYSNESKIAQLSVNQKTINKFGAVSSQTACEMVRGVQSYFNADCAVATTGIAGPTGATKNKPIGLSYIVGRLRDKEIVKEFNFGKDRIFNKRRGAVAALEMIRRLVLEI